MEPVLSDTVTAAELGIAQIVGGVAVIAAGGSAELYLCAAGVGSPVGLDLGTVSAPGAGYFVTENPTVADEVALSQASEGMALHLQGSEQHLFLFGPGGTLSMAVIGAGGQIGAAQTVSSSIGALTGVTTFTVIPDASGDVAALSMYGQSGISLFGIAANGALTLTGVLADSPKSYLASVTDSVSVQIGARAFLLVISALENGLTSYDIAPSGTAILTDSLGNRDGLYLSGPQALQVAEVGGTTFVIIASVTSDSLSVVRVNDMGCLFQADHLIDSQSLRLRGASALDVFELGGRTFVVAGGSDAGLTVLELLPDGTLGLMSSTAFETRQGMGNIASIDAVVDGSEVSIFVTEESGARLQVFSADYSDIGALIMASGTPVSGSGLADRILGSGGADTLSGGGSNDIIHDGDGLDLMSGGAGADVFILQFDGYSDTITDFEDGSDRIDLTAWGRIYAASALSVTATATGVQIAYGDQLLAVNGALTPAMITDSDFIF